MNTPKIRFKGFTDDWEQRKLGDVFEQTTNFVDPNKKEIELWSLTVEDGLTPKSERYNREFLVKKDTGFKEVRSGDIVYNPMNMTLGAVGYNGMSKSVAVSGYYTTMITNEGYDSYYINTWLKSPQAMTLYKTFATGSLIEKQRVQFPTLSIIPATFPQYEEQVRIGYYFMRLDHLITLHQRKCDETKQLKKFMLQKMFPKNGEKNPEIRFEGFTDDWEQRKLGDEATEMLAGGDIDKSRVVENGQYPIYANALTNDGIVGYYDDYYRVKAPAVTVTGRGDVGHAQARIDDFTPVVRLLAIRSEHDVYFLENAINKHGVIVESTGVPQLTVPQLGNYIISFPTTTEEEIKIGSYFHNLDHLITLHQRKCEKLKELKKFMLQNMFV